MKIENIMKMLEVFWPIAIAIYGFFIYKFIPYMKTKIFINEYHNFELFWRAMHRPPSFPCGNIQCGHRCHLPVSNLAASGSPFWVTALPSGSVYSNFQN